MYNNVVVSKVSFSYSGSYNDIISPDCLGTFNLLSDVFLMNSISKKVVSTLETLRGSIDKKGGLNTEKLHSLLDKKAFRLITPIYEKSRRPFIKDFNKLFMLNVVNLYSSKKVYFDVKLFVSNYKLNIYNYNFNKDVFFFNKNIYFFNINKILFVLSQFSLFFYRLLYLRCNILFCSFNFEDYNFFSSSFRLWGYPYIVGNWVNGLFDNWLYYYRKLWNLEVDLWRLWDNKRFHYKLHRNKRFGLMGLRVLPDFMFVFNTGNGVSVNSLYQEVSRYNIPVSSIIGIKDDPRYIIYPLYGEMDNVLLKHFYKLVIVNLFKMGLFRRLTSIRLI